MLRTVRKRSDSTASAVLLRESLRYASSTAANRSGLSEQDIGEREDGYMKTKVKYTDEPMGDVRVVKDFLPSPEELALKDETVKITISLTRRSIEFFKREAELHNTQYQRMIRTLLDEYVAHQR